MKYWLMKTEPATYSWDDLNNEPNKTDHWDGVRNYQARNFMRDMKEGDGILFYHSVVKPPCIVGIARVAKEAYPDHTQFDSGAKYFDPKSPEDNPRWDMVDIQAVETLPEPVTLPQLRETTGLDEMVLLRKGSRLSIQPVTEKEWKIIRKLAGLK